GRRWPGEVLRLAMLMTHYRQPIDFSVRALEVAEKILHRWYRLIGDVPVAETDDWQQEIAECLSEDLNTPQAITRLHAMADIVETGDDASAPGRFKLAANLMGLLTATESEWIKALNADAKISEAEIESLIAARLEARKAKNWAESDRIRDELAAKGIQLKDSKDPATGEIITTWQVAR